MKKIKSIWIALKTWDEWWHIPVAYIFVLISPNFFRMFDETAGDFDIGLIQRVFFAWLYTVIINALGLLMLRMNDEIQYNEIENYTGEGLDKWQRIKLAWLRYSLYLVSMVLLTALLKK